MVTANNNTMGRKNTLNENSFHIITSTPSPSPLYTDFKNFPHSVDICPNCQNIVYKLYDDHRSENFCKVCGIIDPELILGIDIKEENIRVNDEDLAKTFNTFKRIKTKTGYERQAHKIRRIEWLTDRYDRTTTGNSTLWRKIALYNEHIKIVSAELNMNKKQEDHAERLIHQIGNLRNLCKKCKYETVVSALCVYAMEQDKRDIRLSGKNRNRFLLDNGLTYQKYSLILRNMARFFEERDIFPHKNKEVF